MLTGSVHVDSACKIESYAGQVDTWKDAQEMTEPTDGPGSTHCVVMVKRMGVEELVIQTKWIVTKKDIEGHQQIVRQAADSSKTNVTAGLGA